MKTIILMSVLVSLAQSDVSHILVSTTTPEPPPRPYAFGYAAGRYSGHIDRTHSEVSDGSGVVQGSYSYIDPSQKIRTVEYIADKNGFHPSLNYNLVPNQDTVAVAQAKERHYAQFAKIASLHAQNPHGYVSVPRDSAAVAHAKEAHLIRYAQIAEAHKVVPGQVIVPIDSIAVQKETAKHYNLFQQIAEDHAKIAAERKAERLASGIAEEPDYDEQHYVDQQYLSQH